MCQRLAAAWTLVVNGVRELVLSLPRIVVWLPPGPHQAPHGVATARSRQARYRPTACPRCVRLGFDEQAASCQLRSEEDEAEARKKIQVDGSDNCPFCCRAEPRACRSLHLYGVLMGLARAPTPRSCRSVASFKKRCTLRPHTPDNLARICGSPATARGSLSHRNGGPLTPAVMAIPGWWRRPTGSSP